MTTIPPLPVRLDLVDSDIGPFRELRYETADLFLHDLSPHGRLFGVDAPLGDSRWLFRGVKDSAFALIPSAFVEVGAAKLFRTPPELWTHLVSWTLPTLPNRFRNRDQFEAERRVLCAFFYAADTYGLPLPEDSQRLRSILEQPPDEHWPPVDLLSLLALAQHYGCPTRLLDWSPRSHVTAWFAAVGALGFSERGRPDFPPTGLARSNKRLVVWCLSEFEVRFEAELLAPDSPRYEIEVVSAPHAGNNNLHAQHGVFTLTRDREATLDGPPDFSSLDALLDRRHKMAGFFPGHPTVLRMTLPWREARRLLTLLSRSGVSSAALFPGYAGVADALWESRLLMTANELKATTPRDELLGAEPRRPGEATRIAKDVTAPRATTAKRRRR
jgi:FRG domain-containing protein